METIGEVFGRARLHASKFSSYFCDVCESLTDLEHREDLEQETSNSLAGQLKGINCPQKPGFYTFRKVRYL